MSQISSLPEGIRPEDLYDGPAPGQVNGVGQVQQPQQPPPPAPAALTRPIPAQVQQPRFVPVADPPQPYPKQYPAVILAALDVLAARLLTLLALLAACAIWGYTIFDPTHDRILAAGLFSVLVLGPTCVLYWRQAISLTVRGQQ